MANKQQRQRNGAQHLENDGTDDKNQIASSAIIIRNNI